MKKFKFKKALKYLMKVVLMPLTPIEKLQNHVMKIASTIPLMAASLILLGVLGMPILFFTC